MVDIHSHVIWGVDDGARSREESLAMLRLAAETGTTDIVATPHCDSQYKYDPAVRDERIRDLMGATGGTPRIHPGCDFRLSFDNIQLALEEPARFTINGLRYLMVEFADTLIPSSTEEIFHRFIARGICPVITHPERNPILRSAFERLQNWTEIGCLLQVTGQCLTERFGKAAHESAWALLRKGLVHAIASDGHDTEDRPPRLDAAREILTREMGAEAAELLLVTNPAAVIAGEPVWSTASASAGPRKKSRLAFWR
ncbi:MAG: tyrosine-protein phosphatase [Bryobacteraceae bacterium]